MTTIGTHICEILRKIEKIETYSAELVMTKWSSSRSCIITPLERTSLRHSNTCLIILAASISGMGPFLATTYAREPAEIQRLEKLLKK